MRYTPGKLPDRLHLLRLRELDLEVLLLGNVNEMKGQPVRRFCPGMGIGGRRPLPGIVETAEEENQGFVARPNFDRLGIRGPGGGGCKLGGNGLAVLGVKQVDYPPSFQRLRVNTEQLTKGAICLLDPPCSVEQRNAHRSIDETTAKALKRSEGSLPLALGCEVTYDRSRTHLGA